jgi:hypothetical protein
MAVKYATQQQGVADGSAVPANKADAREVNGVKSAILASKPSGTAWASGDTIYLGYKPEGHKITAIRGCTDTSWATSTLSVGVGDDPRAGGGVTTAAKYVSAKTLTATNAPTVLGPLASTMDDAPGDGEHLWATIGTADVAAGTLATLEIEMVGIR